MKFNTIQVLIASTLALGTVAVAQEVSAAEQTTTFIASITRILVNTFIPKVAQSN